MAHKAKEIMNIGNWILYYKPWDGIKCKMVLRKNDLSIDITREEDDEYKIYSKNPIKNLTLDYKSNSSHEPRPYYYYVNREDLITVFNDIDKKLIDALTKNFINMNEINI